MTRICFSGGVVFVQPDGSSNDILPVHSEITPVPQKQPTRRTKKMFIIVILLAFAMLALVVFISLSFFSKPQKQETPSASTKSPIDLTKQYKNPFDRSSTYVNPFENLQ